MSTTWSMTSFDREDLDNKVRERIKLVENHQRVSYIKYSYDAVDKKLQFIANINIASLNNQTGKFD